MLEEVFEVPAGRVPGVAAVHLRIVEELVHGWDLVRAIGARPVSDDAPPLDWLVALLGRCGGASGRTRPVTDG